MDFNYDSNEATDSEDEYTEKEKLYLNKVRNRKNKNSHNDDDEVLKFDDNSDIEDENDDDDGIPDERAWGSRKRAYYDTGFVDQDFNAYNEKEEELAEQEESEAKLIQLRLAKELEDIDYTLDTFSITETSNKTNDFDVEDVFKTDLSNISKREKLQLFKKDSPEFAELVKDFLQNLELSKTILNPVLQYFTEKNIDHPLAEFVKVKNNLIFNYCTNIAFYLVLKAKRILTKNHPIIKRLFQMRKLLLQLEEKYVNVVQPELEKILEKIKNNEEIVINGAGKDNKISTKLNITKCIEQNQQRDMEKESGAIKSLDNIKTILNESEDEDVEDIVDEEMDIGEEKRGITYEIQKNKGLMPHRKKENRNPRVKHRNKFKKALVRRKGAIRTVRTEVNKYKGELSGIKANVVKGIKIK